MFDEFLKGMYEFEEEMIEKYGSQEAWDSVQKKEEKERVKKQYTEDWNKNINNVQIPNKFLNSKISLCDRNKLKIINDNLFVILKGNLGSGKTSTSVAWLKYKMRSRVKKYGNDSYCQFCFPSAKFVRCYEFESLDLNEMKEKCEKLKRESCIIIDDIGFIKNNEFIKRLFSALILYRMDEGTKTIITTNESLKNVFDDRVFDKMQEEFTLIEFDNKNMRKKKPMVK